MRYIKIRNRYLRWKYKRMEHKFQAQIRFNEQMRKYIRVSRYRRLCLYRDIRRLLRTTRQKYMLRRKAQQRIWNKWYMKQLPFYNTIK